MSKFPVLEAIRALNFGLGILIIVAGFFHARDVANVETWGGTEFQVGTFVMTFGGAIVFGSFMFFVAELINVILRVEDHLDSISRKLNAGDKTVSSGHMSHVVRQSQSNRSNFQRSISEQLGDLS